MMKHRTPKAHIVASASTLPEHYYSQSQLAECICNFLQDRQLDFPLDSVRSLFTNSKIDGRYFQFPIESFLHESRLGATVDAAIEACVSLSELNVRKVLSAANMHPREISQIVSVTLTPAVPSICARLMNRVAFSQSTRRVPLAGLGCMAGVAAVSRAADYLEGHPAEAVIVLSCELSSALWQGSIQNDLTRQIQSLADQPSRHDDVVMAIVTAALFGDGSGALLMVGRHHRLAFDAPLSVYANRSNWIPDTEHIMGLDFKDDGMRNILRPEVKTFVGAGLKSVVNPLLDEFELSPNDIHEWTLHPGGPRIMDAAETTFGLSTEKMQPSRDTLRQVGNISSATVLHMIDATLKHRRPPSGSNGMLVAMGPGFSQEAVLVRWN